MVFRRPPDPLPGDPHCPIAEAVDGKIATEGNCPRSSGTHFFNHFSSSPYGCFAGLLCTRFVRGERHNQEPSRNCPPAPRPSQQCRTPSRDLPMSVRWASPMRYLLRPQSPAALMARDPGRDTCRQSHRSASCVLQGKTTYREETDPLLASLPPQPTVPRVISRQVLRVRRVRSRRHVG